MKSSRCCGFAASQASGADYMHSPRHPVEKAMAPHSSTLAWNIPQMDIYNIYVAITMSSIQKDKAELILAPGSAYWAVNVQVRSVPGASLR